MGLKFIADDDLGSPGGHYSQGIATESFIFVSGQLGRTADESHEAAKPFEVQVRQALSNGLAIVAEGGGNRETIVKVTAYIVGIEN